MRRAAAQAAGVALLFACFAAGTALADGGSPARAGAHRSKGSGRVHTVTIEQLRFEPAVLVVHRGDRIVWINKDLIPHTVTAVAKAFDSGSIPPDGAWNLRARKPGEYDYGCRFHPTMKGKLIVR